MTKLLNLFLFLTFVTLSVHAKKCELKENTVMLDWGQFRGTWFEYKSWGDGWMRVTSRCIQDQFTLTDDKSYSRTRTYKTRLIPIPHTTTNSINSTGPSQFTIVGCSFISSDVPMTLLDTDYVNYAIIWSCKDGWFSTTESSWILTRVREPKWTSDVETKLKESLTKFGLSMDNYGDVQQSNCD